MVLEILKLHLVVSRSTAQPSPVVPSYPVAFEGTYRYLVSVDAEPVQVEEELPKELLVVVGADAAKHDIEVNELHL